MKQQVLTFFKTKPFFLLLLPVFFVLHGYIENYLAIPVKDALLLLAEYIISVIIVTLIVFAFLRDWKKAIFFSFLLFLFHFFFGAVHDFLKLTFPGLFFVKYTFIIPFAFLVFLILLLYFRKIKTSFHKPTAYLNIVLMVLIVIDVSVAYRLTSTSPQPKHESGNVIACDSCEKPDIWLIVADEYAGKEELKDLFNFDNASFEDELKNRGFAIIDNAKSNYNYTPFSMASMLNMQYLPAINGNKINEAKIDKAVKIINNPQAIDILKSFGYTIKNFSFFDLDNKPALVESRFLHKRIKLISGQTFLSRLNKDIRYNLVTRFKWKPEMRRWANSQLDDLNLIYNNTISETENKNQQPRFIYTHLLMPHYPYFYNENGEMNDLEILSEGQQTRQKEYLGYLKYANKKFLHLIDRILSGSAKPPIILFMSDHGFREFSTPVDPKYHFMNVNAVYLPNKKKEEFYNGMSNVNQFRNILNLQLGQNFSMLRDSTIFLTE